MTSPHRQRLNSISSVSDLNQLTVISPSGRILIDYAQYGTEAHFPGQELPTYAEVIGFYDAVVGQLPLDKGGLLPFAMGDTEWALDMNVLRASLTSFAERTDPRLEKGIFVRDVQAISDFLLTTNSTEAKIRRTNMHLLQSPLLYEDASPAIAKHALPGLLLIVGGTGAGKTRYIRRSLKTDFIIRWSEPTEDVHYEPNVCPVNTLSQAIGGALFLSLLGHTVVIDSLRATVTAAGSKLGKGGIANELTDMFLQFNEFFASFGVQVACTLNPGVDDPVALGAFSAKVGAVVSSTTWIRAGQSEPQWTSVRYRTHRETTGSTDVNGTSGIVDSQSVRRAVGDTFKQELEKTLQESRQIEVDPKVRPLPDSTFAATAATLGASVQSVGPEEELADIPRSSHRFQL